VRSEGSDEKSTDTSWDRSSVYIYILYIIYIYIRTGIFNMLGQNSGVSSPQQNKEN